MTYSESADPIVAAVLGLIDEPDGWTKVATKAAPPKYEPNSIYCWVLHQDPKNDVDTGGSVELWFTIRVAWAVGTDEETGQVRLEATSDAIDDGLALVQSLVRDNRTSDVWEWIETERTDPQAIITFGERAGWVDLSGYRLIN